VVERTANVEIANAFPVQVLNSSELLDETFDLQLADQHLASCNDPSCCMRLNLDVSVRIVDSGNMQTPGTVEFLSGELIDETLDLAGCFGAHSMVRGRSYIERSANIEAASVTIFDGDVMDELIDIDGNTTGGHWSLNAYMSHVGNIQANNLSICEGELIDEIFDISGDVVDTTWHIEGVLERVGNVELRDGLSIMQGELIDEVFDVSFRWKGYANLSMRHSANVQAKRVHIIGQLLDEFVDVHSLENATIFVDMFDVANVEASSTVLIEQGELVDEVFDIENDLLNSYLHLVIERCANAQAPEVTVLGALVDPLFDATEMVQSSVHVLLRSSANLEAATAFRINPEIGELVCTNEPIACFSPPAYQLDLGIAGVNVPPSPCNAATVAFLDEARTSNLWMDTPTNSAATECKVGHVNSGTVSCTTCSPTPSAEQLWTAPLVTAMTMVRSRLGLAVEHSLNVQSPIIELIDTMFDNTTAIMCGPGLGPDTWVPSWTLPSMTSVDP